MIRDPKVVVGAIGLIILYSVIIAEAGDSQRKCPKKSGNFPIPGSLCKSYFTCKNWRAIGEATCKSDEHFHEIKGWCDSKHLFPCLEKPKSKECLRDNGRFLKSGTGCMWYYDCCNGEANEKRCENGKLFDKNLEKCVSSSRVVCKEKPKSKECLRKNGRFLKSGTGCMRYYDCYNGEAMEKKCKKGKLFDKNLEKCVSSSRVVCKETETSKESTSSESTSNESSEESGSEENFSSSSINDRVSVSFQPKFSTISDIIRVSTIKDVLSTTTDDISKDSTLQELSSSHQTSESDSLDTTFEPTSSDLTSKDSSIISQTIYDITTESIFKITTDSLPKTVSVNPNSMFPDFSTQFSSEATSTDFKPEVILTTQSTSSSSSGERTSQEILHLSTVGSSPSSIHTTYFTRPETTKSRTTGEVLLSTKATTEDLSTLDPEIANFVCPEPTGYFPHPTDKHKFIGCVHNFPYVLTCPSNLIYNHKSRRCLHEY